MSLNGLDATAIAEAAQPLQNIPTAWVLLRYATRDEIELHGNGTGGVDEARASIAAYETKSPLYGVVAYNGSKVLLRYVPQGTSRLLQARVKIHVETLEEFFAHDAELSITTADELTAATLAPLTGALTPAPPPPPPHLAQQLPPLPLPPQPASATAVPATFSASATVPAASFAPTPAAAKLAEAPLSPLASHPPDILPPLSTSTPRTTSNDAESRREYFQEEDRASIAPSVAPSITPSIATSRTAKLLADIRAGRIDSQTALAALKNPPPRPADEDDNEPSAPSPEPAFPERSTSLNTDGDRSPDLSSPTSDLIGQFPAPRLSSSSGYNFDSYLYKPKVKLGPRPTQLPETHSAGVASLPSNVSVATRPPQLPPLPHTATLPLSPTAPPAPASPTRPTSSQTAHVPFRVGEGGRFPLVQSPGSAYPSNQSSHDRPKSRAGSVVTLPAGYGSTPSIKGSKSPKEASQEKLRLMKAVELRRRQQAKERAAYDLSSSAEPSPRLPDSLNSPQFVNGYSNRDNDNVINGDSQRYDKSAASEPERSRPIPLPELVDENADDAKITGDLRDSVHVRTAPMLNAMLNAAAAAQGTAVLSSVPEDGSGHPASGSQQLPPPEKQLSTRQAHLPSSGGETVTQTEAAAAAAAATKEGPARQDGPLWGPSDHILTPPTNLNDFDPGFTAALTAHRADEEAINDAANQTVNQEKAVAAAGQSKLEILPTAAAIQPSTITSPNLTAGQGSETAGSTPAEGRPQATPPVDAERPPAHPLSVSTNNNSGQSRPTASRLHSKDISISTSLSGASFLEELEGTTVEEAQPVTFVKSPISPSFANPFDKKASGEAPADLATASASGERKKEDPQGGAEQETTDQVGALPQFTTDARTDGRLGLPSEAQVGQSGSDSGRVTSPVPSEDRATPFEERETPYEGSPISTVRDDSPAAKKHPTVNPPHIWGGPLRAASNAPTSGQSRHLSPAPELQRLNRSASIASNTSGSMLRPDSPSGVKKPAGVGSRIADRIKALEKSSGGGASSSNTYITPASVSVNSRKSSFNTPPGSSGNDAMRKSAYPTPSPSPGSNIFTRRFGSIRGPASESGRTDNTTRPTQLTGNAGDVQRPTNRPTYIRTASSDSRVSDDAAKKTEMKPPPSRDGASSSSKRGSFSGGRPSFSGGRLSSETPRTGHSRQSSVESTGTMSSEKKKEGKAKKLMKRVSGAFSPRKERSAANPSFSNEPILEGVEQDSPTPTSVSGVNGPISPPTSSVPPLSRPPPPRSQAKLSDSVIIGEVNIQFPDTLLWKRRHMELDSEGYVVLLPSASDRSSRVAPKKYHMSEFHPPYIPDQEREELPYSVILDFMDSSTLQCACQNNTDQINVLHALSTVHSALAHTKR